MIPELCPYCHKEPNIQNYGFDFWIIGCKDNKCINAFNYSKDKYPNRPSAIEGWNEKVEQQRNKQNGAL